MFQNRKVTAILLAGGSGTRFGAAENKVYVRICGKPILQYSLEVLVRNSYVDECILVVKDSEWAKAQAIVDAVCHSVRTGAGEQADAEKAADALRIPVRTKTGEQADAEKAADASRVPVRMTSGGSTRQESVLHGLNAANGDIVLIQDGARPMIRDSYVTRCIETMSEFAGCTAAVRSKDTIKISDDRGLVTQTTDRAHTWIVQTPQCFHREVLLAAHRKYGTSPGITDDCSLLELAGVPVRLVEADYTNLKVTTPEDRILAESFLQASGRGQGA